MSMSQALVEAQEVTLRTLSTAPSTTGSSSRAISRSRWPTSTSSTWGSRSCSPRSSASRSSGRSGRWSWKARCAMASACYVYAKFEQKLDELKTTIGLQDEDLNVNLGPLGDLMSE